MSNTAVSERNARILWIVYLNVILYAFCFQLQRPLEPYLVDKLSTANSADEYARLQSFFSIVQTFGSLFTGFFLDKFSAKTGFVITFISSALSYYILSISTSIEILYLSKIPTVFQAGFLCSQLAASQLTSDGSERVKALGRLTMCYTLGMILGPAMGGWLGTTGDYYFAAKLSTAGSLLSVGLTFLMPSYSLVPSSTTSSTEGSAAKLESKSSGGGSILSRVVHILSVVWLLLAVKILTGVANSIAATVLPLILKDLYAFKEVHMGLFMSVSSGFNAIVNGVFLGPILALFKDNLSNAISVCLLIMFLFYLLEAFMTRESVTLLLDTTITSLTGVQIPTGLNVFIVITFILSCVQYVLSTTVTGESTGRVSDADKGTLLGS